MRRKIDNNYDLENHLMVQHFCHGGIHGLDFTEEEVVEARAAFDDACYPLKMLTFLGLCRGTLEHLCYMFRSYDLDDEYQELLDRAWVDLEKFHKGVDSEEKEMPHAVN